MSSLENYISTGKRRHESENDEYLSDDENYNGIAKNLLNIKEGARWDSMIYGKHALNGNDFYESKGESSFSITKLYEPKFMEIYVKYIEFIKITVDTSQHLMSLCLDHLITFCCWARENNSRNAWIRQILDDNLDLRPEVRNGLAMILIYAFSSAKASKFNDVDMFAALQEAESGLGIVNKTSLKIYNDPFNYFNFLKSCMSGLIDAGKVPENERQNQPKKTKKMAENKDELAAFQQMKNSLVGMFNRGEHLVARSHIQHISDVWQQRHKTIRNRRFGTAVAVMASPPPRLLSHDMVDESPKYLEVVGGGDEYKTASTKSFDWPYMSYAVNSSNNIAHNDSQLSLPTPRHSVLFSETNQNSSVDVGLRDGGDMFSAANATLDYHIDSEKTSPTSGSSLLPTRPSTIDSKLLPPSILIPEQAISGYHQQVTSGRHSVPCNSPFTATPSNGRLCQAVPAMRFERVGVKEWEFNESRIYNVEALVHSHDTVFYLIDETRLSSDERVQKRITSQNTGFTSLQSELQQRGLLITSWPKVDRSHMLDFLSAWSSALPMESLCSVWKSSKLQEEIHVKPNNTSGMLAFETQIQVGIVVRKNEALGITEDCWRLIYPRDLYRDTQNVSLGAFLSTFFPQLRTVFTRLAAGNSSNDLSNVVVKYFSHRIESEVSQAPKPEASCAYQTVGTLNDAAELFILTSRYIVMFRVYFHFYYF